MTGALDGYDGVLFDLDGTLYRGETALPGAVDVVEAAGIQGLTIGYVTNNASRTPTEVAARLVKLGIPALVEQVITSAQATAALLGERHERGTVALVVGTDALAGELERAGLTVVRSANPAPRLVVQGHSPLTAWADLAEACLAIRAGASWIACNPDPIMPTERGELPGNGSMVAALRTATGREPEVVGKPEPRLFEQAARRFELHNPVVIGDRLDTDIAGANRAGMDSLLVLTGGIDIVDLLAAPPQRRPTMVAADLTALNGQSELAERLVIQADPSWLVNARADGIELASTGNSTEPDPVAALRAMCAAWWPGSTGRDAGTVSVRAADGRSAGVLASLGLAGRVP